MVVAVVHVLRAKILRAGMWRLIQLQALDSFPEFGLQSVSYLLCQCLCSKYVKHVSSVFLFSFLSFYFLFSFDLNTVSIITPLDLAGYHFW